MRILLILALTVSLNQSSAFAAVFENRSVEQLSGEAAAVAILRIDSDGSADVGAAGLPVTSYRARVVRARAGQLADGTTITLREVGGVTGGRGLLVSGVPVYSKGDVVLAFLVPNGDGSWRALHHALGIFHQENGVWSRRDVSFVSGVQHSEPLDTRRVARLVDAAAGDWLLEGESAAGVHPVRHDRFSAGGRLEMSVAGNASRFPSARTLIDRAMQAWNRDEESHVYLFRGKDDQFPYAVEDGVSTISLDDPIPGADSSVVGQTFLFYSPEPSTDVAGSYFPITEVDLAVRGTPLPNATVYEELLTHELGHALGFRHSNDGSPSSTDAVMNSGISGRFGSSLGSWDRQALAAVYPQPEAPCVSPSLTISADRTEVKQGEGVTLTASLSGGPASIIWFEGSPGDRSSAIGTGETLALEDLRGNTRVWALGENGCGFANSADLVIRVQVCGEITLFAITPSQTVMGGSKVLLDAQHGGSGAFTYTWYEGALGDTSRPVATSRAVETPPLTRSTRYWIRIKSDCTSIDAGPVVLTVSRSDGRRRGVHPNSGS